MWEFVPLADYKLPGLPARSAAATTWTSLKRIFRPVDEESEAPVKEEAKLHALPQVRLAHLVPPLNLSEAAAALDASLNAWMHGLDPDRRVRFVIGQPHCGHAETVRQWGALHEAALIAPPKLEQILAGDERWFDNWPTDRLWVLPNIERCYLRHARGLTLVRQLLEEAETGSLGRGMIGCNSWSWTYLQRVWPVPRPDSLTLQAFDGPRLARLLTHMVELRPRRHICFRNAATGRDILTVPAADAETRREIIKLAAHCRGNVGTAVSHWRAWLRTEPDTDAADSDTNEKMSQQGEAVEESVWVSATLSEPALPVEMDEDMAFVLHALLIHGGLPAPVLPELLPLSHHRCMAILLRLRNTGLVQCREECWNVAELGYATVREFLRGRDYLTDAF